MRSLNKIKMKETTPVLATKEDVRKARTSLEAKTEQAYAEFAKAKQKVQEQAHLKYLD